MMKGVHQKSLQGELVRVAPEFQEKPVNAILNVDAKLKFCERYIEAHFEAFDFSKNYYELPLKALRNFSFDEICKMRYSTSYFPHDTVDKMFETRPNYTVVHKIKNSMWQWGYGRDVWNEVVGAYEGLRSFSLNLHPDFDIRLDYTVGCNACGNSRFSRTFLDGVFAFLVYYKRKHVMTIGFSFMAGRRLLLQQVQLKERTGNRWLYRFPKNRVEYILGCFEQAFPVHNLYIVDGKSAVERISGSYELQVLQLERRVREYTERLEVKERRDEHSYFRRSLEMDTASLEFARAKLQYLSGHAERLQQFYADTGSFKRGESLTVNGLIHHSVKPVPQQVPLPLAA